MKKAIFGGTFDPIHNGHLYIAEEALKTLSLSKIIFIPSGNPPHKVNKNVTEAGIRYELIKLAISDNPKFEVSDYEIKETGYSYTYKTLSYFHNLEKDTEWYFITGADCLMDLYLWKNVDKILDLCKFVVLHRPGFDEKALMEQKKNVEETFKKKILVLKSELRDISSTHIKSMIGEGKDVRGLVPDKVYEEINRLKLYSLKL